MPPIATRVMEATPDQAEIIIRLLSDMIVEVGEFSSASLDCLPQTIPPSFKDVQWFLFLDETGKPFGMCFLQSVFNYWRVKNRYHLGAFYIAPTHRGQNRMSEIYGQIKNWVKQHDGVQIYCHIEKFNTRSQRAFLKAGFEEGTCNLYDDTW